MNIEFINIGDKIGLTYKRESMTVLDGIETLCYSIAIENKTSGEAKKYSVNMDQDGHFIYMGELK